MGKTILKNIKITPLKIKKVSSGNVMHALKKKELNNLSFGEAISTCSKSFKDFSLASLRESDVWRRRVSMICSPMVNTGFIEVIGS